MSALQGRRPIAERDSWKTPPSLYATLDAEFGFGLDAAADADSHLAPLWFGPGGAAPDGLAENWSDWCRRFDVGAVYLNCPYSQTARWVEKAATERERGVTSVLLVPASTGVRWWHRHCYDAAIWQPRLGVEIRLLPGRITFEGATSGAPFDSAVIAMRGEAR